MTLHEVYLVSSGHLPGCAPSQPAAHSPGCSLQGWAQGERGGKGLDAVQALSTITKTLSFWTLEAPMTVHVHVFF